MDRVINMIVHMVINRLVRRGVDAGIDQIARRRNNGDAGDDLTPEQQARVRENQRNAQQMMRTARRFTRF